jgi:hypothetical protein
MVFVVCAYEQNCYFLIQELWWEGIVICIRIKKGSTTIVKRKKKRRKKQMKCCHST